MNAIGKRSLTKIFAVDTFATSTQTAITDAPGEIYDRIQCDDDITLMARELSVWHLTES